VEAQEKCPLVVDPLAAQLAGSEALASSRRRAESAPKGSGRMFKIGKMAIRTRWFDDQIQAALGMPVSGEIFASGACKQRAAASPPPICAMPTDHLDQSCPTVLYAVSQLARVPSNDALPYFLTPFQAITTDFSCPL
jgi:hypothetical protein